MEKRKAIHPQEPHATSQPSRFMHSTDPMQTPPTNQCLHSSIIRIRKCKLLAQFGAATVVLIRSSMLSLSLVCDYLVQPSFVLQAQPKGLLCLFLDTGDGAVTFTALTPAALFHSGSDLTGHDQYRQCNSIIGRLTDFGFIVAVHRFVVFLPSLAVQGHCSFPCVRLTPQRISSIQSECPVADWNRGMHMHCMHMRPDQDYLSTSLQLVQVLLISH